MPSELVNGVSAERSSNAPPSERTVPLWRHFVVYLISFSVLVFSAIFEHEPPRPSGTSEGGPPGFLSTYFWYEHVVGAADLRDRRVVVITVGKDMPKEFPLGISATNPDEAKATQKGETGGTAAAAAQPLNDACRRRLFINQLLKSLVRHKPKVVVLDIWLIPESCTDERVTETLSKDLGEFSKRAPIIMGLPSRSSADLQADSPADFAYLTNRKPPLKRTELLLVPVTHLNSPDGGITEALVHGDSDTRRIPLSWGVYDEFPSVDSSVQPKWVDTLSVAAVRAFDAHHAVLKRIDALRSDGSPKVSTEPHPFTRFLTETELRPLRAIDVICLEPHDQAWGTACHEARPLQISPSFLNEMVVVVGIVGLGIDVHDSVLGIVPGVILQANYIQSLLNNDVYKELCLEMELLVGAVWLFLVFAIAWRFRHNPIMALLFSILATIVPAYLILRFVIWLGYYTDLVAPLAFAAVATNVTVQFHHFLVRHGGAA